MATPTPARRPLVYFIYAQQDGVFSRELTAHLSVPARKGLFDIWHRGMITAGASVEQEIGEHLAAADLFVLLVSTALLADHYHEIEAVLAQRGRGAQVVPVLLRPTVLEGTAFDSLQILPRDGRSISELPRAARDAVWGQVAAEIMDLVARISGGTPDRAPRERVSLKRIFNTYEVPTYSRVNPKELGEIEEHLREMREGLIIDGPSGVGKSTAVRIALEKIRPATVHRLVGSAPDPAAALKSVLSGGYPGSGGHLIIDDFHLLDPTLQQRVAHLVKYVANEGPDDAKVTLVGVNPVGDTLVGHLADITGRVHRVRMGRQPPELVEELIKNGEAAANILFQKRSAFIESAAGSFFIAQLLCYEAAYREGVRETEPIKKTIESGPEGYVIDKVLQRLRDHFHVSLLTFASCDEQPPPRGACLVLLWLLSQDPNTEVSLEAARARYPTLRHAFDWLMASNLGRYFDRHPQLAKILYYNRETARRLSAEDPRLQFYLRNMEWEAFLQDTAHPKEVRWDPHKGPLFPDAVLPTGPGAPTAQQDMPLEPLRYSQPPSMVLHLSDLHFGTRAQAAEWFDQLAADLQLELRVGKLDAVVISGDIASRADAAEYLAAQRFVLDLRQAFNLTPEQIILVPGNHDLCWSISRSAYNDEDGEERDEVRHRQRFAPFSEFYREVRPDSYSLDEEQQATLHHFPNQRLLLLGLNSAWALDHRETQQASINGVALGHALRQIRNTLAYDECLKIAVFHHPIHSPFDDRIRDTGFLERLAQAGFRLALHGHLHRADSGVFHYDRSFGGRRTDLLGAGTFGAPRDQRWPGIPLQYQLLQTGGNLVRVHTRRRQSEHGAWQPDAQWLTGPGQSPQAFYEIALG